MAGAAFFVFNEAVKGGGYIEVPDVTGMPLARAANLLAEAGLEMGQQTHVVNDRFPEYHVLLQRPEANRVVRQGRKINLTVSARRQYDTAPRLIGRSLSAALTEIEGARFASGSIARMPAEAARDTVLSQDPAPGRDILTGGEIHLLVSEGPRFESLYMPSLVGKTLVAAQNILSAFNVNVIPFKTNKPGAEYDTILAQNPEPGTLLREGQTVTYEIRLGRETLLPSARRRVEVVYEVPAVSSYPEIRVDVIDQQGQRRALYPRRTDYTDGAPPRLQAGALMTVPLTFLGEATLEFYANGSLHKTYYYSGDAQPVITNYDVVSDQASGLGGEDLPPPVPDRPRRRKTPDRWPWRR